MEHLLRLVSFFCLFLGLEVNAGRKKCFFSPSEEKRVDCGYQDLSHVPDVTEIKGFEENKEIEILLLNRNPIKRLTKDSFKTWGQIRRLYLENCELESIDNEALIPLKYLEYLDLTQNLLTFNQGISDSVFAPIGNLETLLMKYNPLGTVPNDAFPGLAKLENLNLAHATNGLKLNSNSFRGLKNLRRLYLEKSELTTLPVGMKGSLNWEILELYLSDNYMHCDCGKRWVNEMNLSPGKIIGTCASPLNMKGTPIYTGKPEQYTCMEIDMSSEEQSTIQCYKLTDEHTGIEEVKKEISAKLVNPKSLGNGWYCFGDTDNKELLLEVSETLKWTK